MESAAFVLVADDVEANVELLKDQLAPLALRISHASDAPTALAMAMELRPDLCILDVSMPAGTLGVPDRDAGFEVCRRLKRDPRTARIPVIFVSALNDPSDRLKGIESGGDDFLVKPHNRHVLGARVRSLLKLKGATDALEESLRRLREVQKARDDLTRMVVHDLKTPLTSMLATLEMLRDGDFGAVGERAGRALSDVEGKAEDLLALIHNLLDVARAEEKPLVLAPEPVAPAAFLAELEYDWALRFRQEQTSAVTDVTDDAPIFHADKAILKRVFSNLIQNAITHSPMPVMLTLAARREGAGILFTVGDDGPGIPAEYQETIFAQFTQLSVPNAPRVFSSGLGLAFCRVAVENHGGRIWVKSTEGQGSTFSIWLPIGVEPVAPSDAKHGISPSVSV